LFISNGHKLLENEKEFGGNLLFCKIDIFGLNFIE